MRNPKLAHILVSFSHSHRHVHSHYIIYAVILQHATVKPLNIIAYEKGFSFYAQPQTGA